MKQTTNFKSNDRIRCIANYDLDVPIGTEGIVLGDGLTSQSYYALLDCSEDRYRLWYCDEEFEKI